MCNDNLSGITVAVKLAETIATCPRRYSYRFLFIPGTIGSITWLAQNEQMVSRIRHGFVLTGVGDAGTSPTKESSGQCGDRPGDGACTEAFKRRPLPSSTFSLMGTMSGSIVLRGLICLLDVSCGLRMVSIRSIIPLRADNLGFVKAESLAQSYGRCLEVLELLEGNRTYMNQNPKCEPQLGRRGLYRAVAGQQEKQWTELALFCVLNASDGRHTLLAIAERADLPFRKIQSAADALLEVGLIEECRRPGNS